MSVCLCVYVWVGGGKKRVGSLLYLSICVGVILKVSEVCSFVTCMYVRGDMIRLGSRYIVISM